MTATGIPDPHVLMQAWLAARYRVLLDGGWVPLAIDAPLPAVLDRHVAGAPCALLTAFNPGSVPVDASRNRLADAALRSAIDTGGWRRLPSLADAVDGSWPEPGWLIVGIDMHDADALARRFGQAGLLYRSPAGPVLLRMPDLSRSA